MRYSLIILSLTSKTRPEVAYFSNSATNNYDEIVKLIPSYESTEIKIASIGDYNTFVVIREDHPLFNIGKMFDIISNHRISPLFSQSVSLMKKIYTQVINANS